MFFLWEDDLKEEIPNDPLSNIFLHMHNTFYTKARLSKTYNNISHVIDVSILLQTLCTYFP